MVFKDLLESIQRKIRWIPAWKKKRIATIFKIICGIFLTVLVLGGGYMAVRKWLPQDGFSLPETFQIASFKSRDEENNDLLKETTNQEPADADNLTQKSVDEKSESNFGEIHEQKETEIRNQDFTDDRFNLNKYEYRTVSIDNPDACLVF